MENNTSKLIFGGSSGSVYRESQEAPAQGDFSEWASLSSLISTYFSHIWMDRNEVFCW